MSKQKKSLFETPLLSSKIKSANVKLFPELALGYFIGPTLALLVNSVLGTYFNQYMSDILHVNTWASGFFNWLPVVSVIFVVIGNILVGRLLDKNKTKAGKARPLILLSIPLTLLALLCLFVFTPYVTEASDRSAQIWALVFIALGYNLFFAVAYPFYYTSHAALVNLSTRNGKDRSLLATASNATLLAAMGVCTMIVPIFFLNWIFVKDPNDTQVTLSEASYANWKIFVIVLIVVTAVGALIEYFFTRERVSEETATTDEKEEKKSVPLGKQMKVCFKDKYWVVIIVFFLLYQLGGMMKNVSQLYFCRVMWGEELGGIYSGSIGAIGAIPTALGMVVAWPLSQKIGKGKAILFGSILSTIGGIIGLLFPHSFPLVVVSFVVKAFGSTPAMYLSLALLADILDHQEATSGFRTDGFTMTFYGAIMAGMTGIATGIMNIVLTNFGYDATAGVSTPALQSAMPWIFIGAETIGYGIIAIIFIVMKVEKFSIFDKKVIVLDQKEQAEKEGKEFVDPALKLKMEEEQAERDAEELRRNEFKALCEKKGLNVEEELAKFDADADAKRAEEAKKKQEEEAKRLAEEQKKLDSMSAEQKEAILAEINKLRQENGQRLVALEELA